MSYDDRYDDDNPYAYDDSSDDAGDGSGQGLPRGRRRQSRSQDSTGMSKGMKIVLGVALGAGVLMFLCCGGVFLWLQNVAQDLENSITQDPAEIDTIEQTIADITPPAGIERQAAMNFGMFGFGMKMVIFSDQEIDLETEGAQAPPPGQPPKIQTGEGSSMMLISIVGPEMSDEDAQAQFRQGFGGSGDDNFEAESTETRTFTIGGTECDFVFAKGKIRDNDADYRQVTGAFPGREGPAFLVISIPEEDWDEEAITQTIESINVD